MLNSLRNKSMWGTRLKGVLAALLFAGSSAALAAPVTVNLCATTGSVILPPAASASAPVFGYALGACTSTSTVTVPGGPVIAVNVGDDVTVNLYNNLAIPTGLLFQGQGMVPDTTGQAAGSPTTPKSYTFKAANPGTFLYEAALLPNVQYQVAMGLYGALVVKPDASVSGTNTTADSAGITLSDSAATFTGLLVGGTLTNTTDGSSCTVAAFTTTTLTCSVQLVGGTGATTPNTWALGDAYTAAAGAGFAYGSLATSFNDEAVLVLSEIDPVLNKSADPAAFDMRNYAPKYFLINGKPYPDTGTTAAIASAADHRALLRYVNAGAKHHSMAVLGLRQVFVAKDASPLPTLNHNVAAETLAPGQTGDAIVTIPATTAGGSKFAVYDANLKLHNSNAVGLGGMLAFVTASGATTVPGPVVTALTLTGNPQTALTATITASTGQTVTNWQYWVDNGSTTTITTPPALSVSVTATIPVQPTGNHNLYVRGQDNATPTGTWGAIRTLSFALDTTGPTTSGLTLTPNPSNGLVSVTLSATANDSASGGSNVTAAEYTIDGGVPVAMTLGGALAPVRGLTATIPAGLLVGAHPVTVRSRDALLNWGAVASITLNVIAGGPATTAVSVTKSPNNGAQPLNASQPVVRVTATMTSTGGTVSGAEGFIDVIAAAGTGFPFVPSDGAWGGGTEIGTTDIPLSTINGLPQGNHAIYVRGRDAAGNWGSSTDTATTWPAAAKVTLVIDKTAPTFTGISLAPTPTLGAANVVLTVNGAADPLGGGVASGVAGGEYWINPPTTTDPAAGSGTAFNGLTATIPVGALANGTYTVRARVRDAAGNWSTGTNGIRQATLTVAPDAIFSNGFEAATAPWGWTSRSINTTGRLNRTAAAALVGSFGLQGQGNNTNYVQYDFGSAANPASGTLDARFYFNPNGNTGTNQDIFVARTTGGTTVFRVRYRWNAGSPQVQIQVGTGTGNAAWTNITNAASNRIEVVWQSGGTLQLFVGASLVADQSLTATATSVGQFRLGSVTSGGNANLEYFDAFSAKRSVAPYGP